MLSNPLRIFDCKLETCREQLLSAPKILDFLCPPCDTHFQTFRKYLSIADITPSINAGMVRGLDYYTRTAFEVTTGALGAQNAVLGGGRYNGLARELGGPDIPGIGFAIGLERLLSLIEPNDAQLSPVPHLFVAFLGDQAGRVAFDLANGLRKVGIRTEVDYAGRSLKSQMRRANKLNCPYTLILGDREIAAGEVQWRDMRSSLQETLPLDGLFETIRGKLLEKGQTLV
jgi:histidyl-tRNA synthetase